MALNEKDPPAKDGNKTSSMEHQLNKTKRNVDSTAHQYEPKSEDSDEVEENETSLSDRADVKQKLLIENQIEHKIQQAEEERRAFVKRIRDLEDELAEERRQHLVSLGEARIFENERNMLTRQLNQEKQSKMNANRKCKKALTDAKESKKIADELEVASEELKAKLTASEKRNSKLNSDVIQVQKYLVVSEAKRRDIENMAEESAQNLEQLKAQVLEEKKLYEIKVNELNEKVELSQNNLEIESQDAQKLRSEIDQIKILYKLGQEEKLKSEKSLQASEQMNAKLKSRFDTLHNSHQDQHQKIMAKIQATNIALQEQLENETKAKLEANRATRLAERKVKQLSTELEEEKRIQQHEKIKLEKINYRLNTYKDQLNELEEKLSTERNRRKMAEQELEEAVEAKEALEKELLKLKGQAIRGNVARTVSNDNCNEIEGEQTGQSGQNGTNS